LWIVPAAGGKPFEIARDVPDVDTFAWSPDGRLLAFSGWRAPPPRQNINDRLYTVPTSGRASTSTVRYRATFNPPPHGGENGIRIAGWWPDGKGILFWLDPYHSSSIAADGLELYSLDLATGTVHRLAKTLTYPDWLAFAPTGDRVLLVAGGPRPAYYGKRLMLCRESGSCQAVVERQGVVSFDPAWSPDGREIAFTEAHALVAWGFSSKAPLRNWIRSHTLRIANADGSNPHQVTAAGNGVYDPEWSRDGRGILFVRDNALWFDANVGASSPQKVAQLFPARTRIGFASPCCGLFYYGHVQWDSLFAWDQG
jgi:TolB protein